MGDSADHSIGQDRGYAWVVAAACFFINFIMVGFARSVSVMYVAVVEAYGVSRQSAVLPFSIRVSLKNLSGPLIGLLGLRYGIRAVTIVGAFVAALGSVLCYFAPNILWITGFWGIIHGTGFGLSTVLHMMAVNQYFDKYKASALGLAYSGDCFGTFAFPLIMEYLLANYTVKETFLIIGSIVLNVVPMAMLLRKPPWLKSKKKKDFFKTMAPQGIQAGKVNDKDNAIESKGYRNEAYLNFDEDLDLTRDQEGEVRCSNKVDSEKEDELPAYQDAVSRHRLSSLKCEMSSVNGSFRSQRKPSEISDLIRDNIERHDSLPPVFEKEIIAGDGGLEEVTHDKEPSPNEERKVSEDGQRVQYSTSMRKRASSYMGQMAVDIVHRMRSASFASQVAQDGFIASINQEQKEDSEQDVQNSGHRKLSIDENGCCKNCGQEVVLSVIDLKLSDLKEATPSQLSFRTQEYKQLTALQTLIKTNTKPIFVLISMTMAVYVFLFVGVLTVIIDYAEDLGVSQDQGKFLIIVFSVTDLFGRLSFGQVIDRKLVKLKNYSGVTMLLMGTFVAAIPLNTSFNYMMVCMCLYGLVQGGTAIMFPILIGNYMDKNEESVAMGCMNFYAGLLMLCMAPMIGYFRDNTGSYKWVFHIQGGLVAFIGLIWQLEPLILKFQRKQQLKRAERIVTSKL